MPTANTRLVAKRQVLKTKYLKWHSFSTVLGLPLAHQHRLKRQRSIAIVAHHTTLSHNRNGLFLCAITKIRHAWGYKYKIWGYLRQTWGYKYKI